MKARHRKKHDYVAEVDLPSDELVHVFVDLLAQRYGFKTEGPSKNKEHFISKRPKPSLANALFSGIPTAMEWRIVDQSLSRTCIGFYFPLPAWFRNRFYVVSVFFTALFYLPQYLMGQYFSVGLKYLTGIDFGIIFLCFLTTIMAFAALFILLTSYFGLLIRYDRFVNDLLREFSETQKRRFGPVKYRIMLHNSRYLIDVVPAGVMVGCFAHLIVSEMKTDYGAMPLFLLVIVAVPLLILFRILIKLKRKTIMTMAGVFLPSVILSVCVGVLLLVAPMALYMVADGAIDRLNAAGINGQMLDGQLSGSSLTNDEYPSGILNNLRLMMAVAYLTMFMGCLFVVVILMHTSRLLADYWHRHSATRNRNLSEAFHEEILNMNGTAVLSLNLSMTMRVTLVLLFSALSLICWAGMITNLSLLNAIIAPNFKLINISYGWTIAHGMMLMSGALSGRLTESHGLHVLRAILVAPALVPCFFFIFLNS